MGYTPSRPAIFFWPVFVVSHVRDCLKSLQDFLFKKKKDLLGRSRIYIFHDVGWLISKAVSARIEKASIETQQKEEF